MFKFLVTIIFFTVLISCDKEINVIDRPLTKDVIKIEKFLTEGAVSVARYSVPPGGDTSISAELGGPGFENEYWKENGWQTRTDFPTEGSDRAVKGGALKYAIGSFPSMYRTEGKGSNQSVVSTCTYLLYESLLGWDRYDEFIPKLASHWKIENEGTTISMRLNPNARWNDGMPLVADDVVATYNLLTDPGLLSPYTKENYEQFSVEKISKYIVKFQFKKQGWRNLYNAGLWYTVYPAHCLNKIDGKTYLQKYQFTTLPGTGPYVFDYEQTIKGKKITLRRREDYWGKNLPQNRGRYNYDKIVFLVVRDASLEYEKFKKGELDIYQPTSKEWVTDLDLDNPKSGLEEKLPKGIIQKRKVFAYRKKSFNGMALNMRKPPFNDIRVRKAFAMLYNRKQICDKLEFGETVPLDSHWPYSKFKHPDNVAVKFNPREADRLLDEAGWTERNEEGYRKHPDYGLLEITINLSGGDQVKKHTIFQQNLQKAGIKYNIKKSTWPTISKILDERNFKVQSLGWGAAAVPNLESTFNSKLGKQKGTNNMTGLNIPALDSLNEVYKRTFDLSERVKIVQKVDSIAYNTYHYVFGTGVPYSLRIAFLNKFGTVESLTTYKGSGILEYWWIDQEKESKVKKALAGDNSISFSVGETIVDFWNIRENNKSLNIKGVK
jgi:microcin C transport system substrate-binding protein